MTFHEEDHAAIAPAILTPETQQAVQFLGGLTRVRLGGTATSRKLAVLEHQAERGYNSPVHRHHTDEETFFVVSAYRSAPYGG
jgi:hypothetical protein